MHGGLHHFMANAVRPSNADIVKMKQDNMDEVRRSTKTAQRVKAHDYTINKWDSYSHTKPGYSATRVRDQSMRYNETVGSGFTNSEMTSVCYEPYGEGATRVTTRWVNALDKLDQVFIRFRV